MAYVVHPDTGKVVEAQKKGKSKNGEKQYWLNKKTKKRFTTDMDAENFVDQETKKILKSAKTPTKKPAAKRKPPAKRKVQSNKQGSTVIKVNNNTIKELKGTLSKEEAVDVAAEYFKEIQKDKVKVTTQGDKTTFAFQITTGRKG